MSLVLVGNNSLVETLRIPTSTELFMNVEFYSQHPCFLSALNEHSNNLLPMSVSFECLDTSLTKADLVIQEAILNCTNNKWSSFLCILGLSSVLRRNISTYYPDCSEDMYKLLFNRLVLPRQDAQKGVDNIHILFCRDGNINPGETFQSNHFVPLLLSWQKQKRKSAELQTLVIKKQKLTSILPTAGNKNAVLQVTIKASNKADANILNFFTVKENPIYRSLIKVFLQPHHLPPIS